MIICRLEGIEFNLNEVHFVPSLIDFKYAQLKTKRALHLFFPLTNRVHEVTDGRKVFDILEHQVLLSGQIGGKKNG